MRLIEQFRVVGLDGRQHTVACYQDHYDRPDGRGGQERVETILRYCLNGVDDVQRVDDETFLTLEGAVLWRVNRPLSQSVCPVHAASFAEVLPEPQKPGESDPPVLS